MTNSTPQLSALSEEFVEVACRLDPVGATLMGIHDYDDRFPDDSSEGFDERLRWLKDLSRRLADSPSEGLIHAHRVDYTLLRSRVDALCFHLEALRPLARNPVRFTETAMQGIFLLAERPFAPLDERKEFLLARLLAIPGYLEGARRGLE